MKKQIMQSGAMSLVLGILTIVFGVTTGILSIVNGGRLLGQGRRTG